MANLSFLEQPLVILVTGAFIRANTGGDKVKEAARAAEVAAIANALKQVNDGATTAGLAALQAALQTKVADPAESLALQSLISSLAPQFAALQATLGGTVLGQVQTLVFNNIIAAVLQTCAVYTAA